jgi:uncharacterized phage protein (TIGR02216 family)
MPHTMTNRPKIFPWADLMDLGLRQRGLSPTEFWRSTLRELIPQGRPPPTALLRQTLEHMMQLWPDQENDT